MDQRLQEIYNQLESVYAPQRAVLQQQAPLIEQQAAAQRASLEQARQNAFRDITTAAGNRGMLFSGFTPAEQATYTGTKYLPALAGVEQTAAQRRLSLEQQLGQTKIAQQSQAQNILQKQIQEENRAREAELNRQTRLQAAMISAGGRRGGRGGRAATEKAWGKVQAGKGAGGGFAYQGPGGIPVSAATWAYNNNVPLEEVLAQDPTRYAQEARNLILGNRPPTGKFDLVKKNLYNQISNLPYQGRLEAVRRLYPALF